MNKYFSAVTQHFSQHQLATKTTHGVLRHEIIWGLLGSSLAMFIIGWLHTVSLDTVGLPLLVAPFGASAVLAFGAFRSPFAQPRNIIGGHVISALVGITIFQIIGAQHLAAICLAVPLAIAAMQLTGTVHPPGGATAFLTAAGGNAIHELGYWYVLMPCAAGTIIMVAIALLINNIPHAQRYPHT